MMDSAAPAEEDTCNSSCSSRHHPKYGSPGSALPGAHRPHGYFHSTPTEVAIREIAPQSVEAQ